MYYVLKEPTSLVPASFLYAIHNPPQPIERLLLPEINILSIWLFVSRLDVSIPFENSSGKSGPNFHAANGITLARRDSRILFFVPEISMECSHNFGFWLTLASIDRRYHCFSH